MAKVLHTCSGCVPIDTSIIDTYIALTDMVNYKKGDPGKSAYQIAVENGFDGTEEDWLASLKGDTGETPDISIGTVTTGESGSQASATMAGTAEEPVLNLTIPRGNVGATPNFTIGTVTTGAAGTDASVSITGTADAPVLNLTIPQGVQGNTGSSVSYPYELVNNRTTNDATKGLTAAEGKRLGDDLSQLSDEVPHTTIINGQNLYNSSTATHAYVDSTDGNVVSIADGTDTRIKATDFIDIGADGLYVGNGTAYGTYGGWAVYDENKNFIRGGRGNKPSISYQVGDRYIRATIDSGGGYDQQINVGSSLITPVVPYVDPTIEISTPNFKLTAEQLPALDGELLENNSVSLDKCSFTNTITGKNLLNPSLMVSGKWIKSDGTTANVTSSYGYYDYIGVEPETDYHISNSSDKAISSRTDAYIAFYDANKSFLSSVESNTKNITTPADGRFVRISYETSRLSSQQMEVGSYRTTYQAYFAPYDVVDPSYIVFPDNGVTTQKIADGAVTQDKIADGVSVAPRPSAFRGFRVSDTEIAGTESITTDLVYVAKDVSIIADITGNISSVSVGIGRNGTYGRWAEITPTKLIVKYGTSGSVLSEYNHGLTLGTRTKVIITKTVTSSSLSSATIKIVNDYGDVFSQSVTWGVVVGRAFVYNGGSSPIGAELSFMLRDLTKMIWMFGDSYFSFDDNKRWPYYTMTWGFLSYLMNARGGETATQALADLNVLLSLGFRPSYIVWTLGMNSGADSGGTVNSTWLGVTEQVIDICNQYSITPILATVPSVPSEIHEALNEWVRSSGLRYIDFAKAVESDTPGDYHWRGWGTPNALLSSDEVHPSARGAVELAMRALLDFPEMTIKEN